MNPSQKLKAARTKTVATIGPASSSVEMLEKLLLAGADVFRINMAHGKREAHEQSVANIRQASENVKLPAGILVDLAGPKIRLGQLATDPVELENGQQIRFVRGTVSQSPGELTCIYEPLIDEVSVGDTIVLADGIARLVASGKGPDHLDCHVVDGGAIRSRQGVNLPGTNLSVPALGELDKDNAVWAAQQGVEFISLSFVRNAQEIEELKSIIKQHGSSALVVAKIEKREALDELEAIVKATGAVMVARGDLGVEIEIERTPMVQKRIIRTCLAMHKPVIVATQMLESMHTSKQPTRAEVSDVANAILDGADACMLSGETAIGQYPVEAVTMMNKIMQQTETVFESRSSKVSHREASGWPVTDSVVFGAAQIARRINAKMVVIASAKPETALVKSKQRDFIQTICITDRPETYRQMALFWGVIPVLSSHDIGQTEFHEFVNQWVSSNTSLIAGDRFVMVADNQMLPGIHDSVLVATVR